MPQVDLHDAGDAPVAWVWPLIAGDVEDAASHSDDEVDAEMVHDALERGAAAAHLVYVDGAYRGVVVTEFDGRFVNLIVARVRYTGGDTFGFVLRRLQAWAVEAYGDGAKLIGSSRRPGMARLLARHGWRPRFVEFVSP
jgi:hypothetical protein